ncbi:MAG: tRNA (adenosine(37)-N6)-dimethylallyltransferase MiaA [Gammaproteobacteria bacterium]|nr:tRNA (adenosine(37)-N6)-dimethylallyltransferase MiaA [Gammaproteobacteria bacterium]
MVLCSTPSSGHTDLPGAIFLMGPTASGKTSLAIDLVRHLPCEIISVDSALVYRGMDIGTAKPDLEQLAIAPHRLIDICDPDDAYSAARFREDALTEMAAISAAGRIPLLVGGTMLYFRALQYGLSELPQANAELRSRLSAQADQRGWGELHRELAQLDPVAAQRIHINDPQRIQRALEVYYLTGQPISELQKRDGRQVLDYQVLKLVLSPRDRALLHTRIEARFLRMLELGFENEVRELLRVQPALARMPSMRLVGYRQMLSYIQGEFDEKTMIEKGIIATRQLAKRQLTWIRSESNSHWLDEAQGDILGQALKIFEGDTINQ